MLGAPGGADAGHTAETAGWERFIDEEERRLRGGATLTPARLARAPGDGALDPWPSHESDVVPLFRAARLAHLIPDRRRALAAGALHLCGAGRTDRIILLPFIAAVEGARGDSFDAWLPRALEALAITARARRRDVEHFVDASDAEVGQVDVMGRAAINARRALRHLHDVLATSMPALADGLELSRPAAADALERLEGAGLITEVTGRRRDRLYCATSVLAIAESATTD